MANDKQDANRQDDQQRSGGGEAASKGINPVQHSERTASKGINPVQHSERQQDDDRGGGRGSDREGNAAGNG